MNNDILNLTNLGKNADSEEIPEPGTEGNPWVGMNRMVNGLRQFYAFSGAEIRRIRRANARTEAAQTAKGQRAYNRQQRQREFDAGTVRMQAKILGGEVPVTPAMMANLHGHILRQTRLNERADTEPDRKATAAARREARLFERRHARVAAGNPRHADLVALGMREA